MTEENTFKKYLKGVIKPPHRIKKFLIEEQVKELENSGETLWETSLRFNYPILTGVEYAPGKMATITSKRISGSFYVYLLEAHEDKKKELEQ